MPCLLKTDSGVMPPRIRVLVSLVIFGAAAASLLSLRIPSGDWPLCVAYAAALLLTTGMKVQLFSKDGTMSVNFPFLFLAALELSPAQAMALAAGSVFVQCKFRVEKHFTPVQIAFNVGSAVLATGAFWLTLNLLGRAGADTAPSLAIASVVFFLFSTLPVTFVIAWSKETRVLGLWRSEFLWFLPFYLVGAALAALANYLIHHFGWPTALVLLPVAYTIYRAYNAQIARMEEHERHIQDMTALHLRTIEGLAMAIEAKDQDTHDHLLRVRVYVTEMGKALNLSAPEMEAVKTAALLHDIGKLAVPERIINKPGKLTPEEFEIMKIHPAVGADILERVRFPYPVVPIVRAHHEWWNGGGYPDGLKGEAIPIGARILSAVDSFDALASDRPYRRAMPLDQAMGILKKLSGTQFDPRVIEVLEARYVELEELARQENEKLKRLETNIAVSGGEAPGAGFEKTADPGAGTAKTVESEGSRRGAEPVLSLGAALAEHVQTLNARTGLGSGPAGGLALNDALAVLGHRLAGLLPFDCAVFHLRGGDELFARPLDARARQFFSLENIPFGEGISGWAALHQQAIVNANATVEPTYLRREGAELRSALVIPLLRSEDGSLLGVLSFYSATPDAFSLEQRQELEKVSAPLAAALGRAFLNEAYEQEQHALALAGSPSADADGSPPLQPLTSSMMSLVRPPAHPKLPNAGPMPTMTAGQGA
jgi:putative nucleotidyltransferase with HDIG domain